MKRYRLTHSDALVLFSISRGELESVMRRPGEAYSKTKVVDLRQVERLAKRGLIELSGNRFVLTSVGRTALKQWGGM